VSTPLVLRGNHSFSADRAQQRAVLCLRHNSLQKKLFREVPRLSRPSDLKVRTCFQSFSPDASSNYYLAPVSDDDDPKDKSYRPPPDVAVLSEEESDGFEVVGQVHAPSNHFCV
jgi:hypothetical protein